MALHFLTLSIVVTFILVSCPFSAMALSFLVTFILLSCPFSAMALSFVVTFTLVYCPFCALSLTICLHLWIGVLSIICSVFDCLVSSLYWCLVHSLLCLSLFLVTFTFVSCPFPALSFTISCHLWSGVLSILCSVFDFLLSSLYYCLVHSLLCVCLLLSSLCCCLVNSMFWLWLFVVIFTLVSCPFPALSLTICCYLYIGVLSILCSDFDCLLSPLYWCLVHSLLRLWQFVVTFILVSCPFFVLVLSFVATFTLVSCPYSVLALSVVVTFILVSCPFPALALTICCHLYIGVFMLVPLFFHSFFVQIL